MLNQRAYALGANRSCIRELFEYGRKRAAIVGENNIFDYSLGNPSIPSPAEVDQTIRHILDTEDITAIHGYTSAIGDEATRQAIAQDLNSRYDAGIRAEDLFLTCGAAPALTAVLRALSFPGSEVVAVAPFFPEYRPFAEEAGHTRLSTISQSKVRTILEEADIKPNKITYYCENRDPDFDQKMHNVLLVYKQLSLQFDETGQLIPFKEDEQVIHVLSYDEKPGIQAIANTSEDLSPDKNHKTFSRDYEYKRLGTVSLLAGIDLQTGEAIPLVRDKHSSKEYIEFLKFLKRTRFVWYWII